MAVTNEYILGYGKVSIEVVRNLTTNKMAIKISDLVSNHQVGENLKGNDNVLEKNTTRIYIDNIEGLSVLEKAIKAVRKKLKSK